MKISSKETSDMTRKDIQFAWEQYKAVQWRGACGFELIKNSMKTVINTWLKLNGEKHGLYKTKATARR